MIRKAPSPVRFEGGLECRPEDRAAPALVIETQAAVLHRHALHHRELIVAAMRELAHQELGFSSAIPKRAGRSCRRSQATHEPPNTYASTAPSVSAVGQPSG